MEKITLQALPEPLPATDNAVLRTIFQRRAVRKYHYKTVNRVLTDQLIQAARMAPSAMNRQPYRFIIIDNSKDIRDLSIEIMKVAEPLFHLAHNTNILEHDDAIFYNAPLVILLAGPAHDDWAALDIGMATQNLLLAAKSMGLETCVVGFASLINQTPTIHKLQLENGEKIYLAVIVGYGEETPAFHGRKSDNAVYHSKL